MKHYEAILTRLRCCELGRHMPRRSCENGVGLIVVSTSVHSIAVNAHQKDEQARKPAIPQGKPQPE